MGGMKRGGKKDGEKNGIPEAYTKTSLGLKNRILDLEKRKRRKWMVVGYDRGTGGLYSISPLS